ncbi:MAG: FAD-dependent oxidoreductase [Anaerolineae bacterium]|nr:FAD-dependent oxidoreductase [Anaerolineae bacterium]MDQ7034702.1 FAD-dependent oxidoreductase [Anaerolineae bacterium]
MSNDSVFSVVIIGGGLAGLSAAAHLAERGIEALVLDADSLWAGGRLAGGDSYTFEYQGRDWSFKPEHGVHGLWGGYVNMRAMLKRFTDTVPLPSAGEEWINRWGREVRRIEAGNAIRSRWIPAPFHYLQLLFHPQIWANIQPWDFLSLPGFLNSIFLTLGVDPLKEQRVWDGLTLRDFFIGWTPNLRTTFEGLASNLLAAPKDEISLTGFIAALRFYTMLRRDSWQIAYLPADAHTSIIQPLTDYINTHGGAVEAGITATKLEQVASGWRVTVDDSKRGGLRSLMAEQLILAVDSSAAKRLLCHSPDTATIAENLIFPDAVASAVVRLWFDAAPREGTQGGMMTGDFKPDNFFWLHRMYDDCRAWHDETGGSIIELHYYDPALINLPERNLIVESVTEVQRAFPQLKRHFVHAAVRRNSKTHGKFRVPDSRSLFVETPFPQLYACGDWIGYDTPSMWMERSTTTAIAAANQVLVQHGKEPYPILQPPQPEMLARIIGGIMRVARLLLTPIISQIRRLRKRK